MSVKIRNMTSIILIAIGLIVANLVRSVAFAYRTSCDGTRGGYPIYGDAVHTAI